MKTFFPIAALLLLASFASAQEPRPTAIPPGPVQAGQAEAKEERDLPPPAPAKASINLEKLQSEANELSKLAQTVPSDVADIRNGILPKEVVMKLKQIEKLSKQLRGQLNP